ncbi:PREDICTED: transmembrane protein 135-like [Eufriesea mexicana]|uniref:transmembrane protein 135-like n=1 Tax=Eufriesea mexicana TaxID=516756 RepID=UPI00083C4BDE|nr:PREDICTED: transmembrane protein 135-like [Eufriesea mexicana]
MPSQLSKFIDISCKEYAHPWGDSCVNTAAGLGLDALQECLRIYSTVYIVALLLKGKKPSKGDIKKTILGFLQSTAFLSWSAFSYSMFICLLRRILGNFNFLTISFFPSFLSSLSAIIIERPSRRTLLSLYVSNIATETLFRMGVARGYYSPISQGGTYIFATSLALLLYFYRTKPNNQDSIYKILRIIVGKYEGTDYPKEKNELHYEMQLCCSNEDNSGNSVDKHDVNKSHKKNVNIFMKSLETYKKLTETLKHKDKHISCPHPFSCIIGLTFMFYSSNTITLYFMWKALQLLWNDLVEKKIVPEVKWFQIFLYCFSTAVLFHVSIFEPHLLRSSYWKFLYTISGGRVAIMSRVPLDIYGLETSKHLADVCRKTNTSTKKTFSF